MIKHKDMMQQISSGEEFSCVYLKSDGTLTEFTKLCKPVTDKHQSTVADDGRRTKSALQSYLLLIPFQTANGEVRELYTRLIVKFNNEEVSL